MTGNNSPPLPPASSRESRAPSARHAGAEMPVDTPEGGVETAPRPPHARAASLQNLGILKQIHDMRQTPRFHLEDFPTLLGEPVVPASLIIQRRVGTLRAFLD